MKKLFAVLLVLALLLPMGIVAHAEEAETKPFYMTTWSSFESDLDNVYYMPFFWGKPSSFEENEMPSVSWGVSDIAALAEKTKEEFDARPEGSRHINLSMANTAFHELGVDACIFDKAVPVVQMWLKAFLAEYKKIGGKLDGLVVDIECFNINGYYIHSNFFTKDPLIYDKITKNPAYTEKIRPMLVERGFKFYSPVSEHTPEIYSIHPNSGDEFAQSRSIWDSVMRSYLNQLVTDACSPVWDYYPDALVSDYTSKDVDPWLKEVSESGGVVGGGGITTTAGNASNENFYAVRPYPGFYKTAKGPAYNTLPGYNKAIFEESPFTMLLFDTNVAKNTYLASDTGKVTWWIAHYLYSLDNPQSYSNTPYYSESLLHLGMLNPELFMGYILKGEVISEVQKVYGDTLDDPEGYGAEKYEVALTIVDECLKELTRVVGAADRKPIQVVPTWSSRFLLSGMYAGGKNIWRITPDTSKVSLENFKVDGNDPTFSVGGETVTFPGGKIIADSKIMEIGTCGYWIETAKDVTPVITRPADYYTQYPAFQETFEGYEVGTEYNYDNALPTNCWENKKQGSGSATVVADPTNANNKLVELKGSYTLKNITMPGNIIAGDTYAEKQAWEVTVTLPADMAADGEMVLLNVIPEKKKATDGGFKVIGTKVYYDEKGEYVELAGVTLTAGATYTFQRKMNFSDAEAFTCDYYIYDAEGKVVGKAKNIALSQMDIPVYAINMSVKNISGGAVLMDNYKLYQISVATDFYLYNAKSGLEITETDKAQSGNVAYRLSWMNATQTEKSYTVMAAYYNGDALVTEKVVQEVKMTPGMESVLTGIVENTEGQTVKVYLKDNNPPEQDEDEVVPGDDDTKKPDNAGLDMTMILVIAAAAVVVIAVVVVVVVASSKKKKKNAAAAVEAAPEANETEAMKPESEKTTEE